MVRHSRRYYFGLAERLGMTVRELLERIDARELSEWMAYDLTQCDKWAEEYRQSNMTPEQVSHEMKRLFGLTK